MTSKPVTVSDDEKAKCMAALAEAAFMPLPKYDFGFMTPLETELERKHRCGLLS